MRRNTLLETAGRAMHGFARVTLNKSAYNHLWQMFSIDAMNGGDRRENVEYVENYGFTGTVLPRDEQKAQSKSQEGGVENPKGPAAEGICVYIGGQRNHPVCVAMGDRRHRPRLKPGETAQYDDNGQMTLIRRAGTYMLSLDDDKQAREVSMRHVTKSKQPKPEKGKEDDDFKHEGESVNAEVKILKDRIQFIVGGEILGEVTKDGFVIGGQMSDKRKQPIHRRKDIDDMGATPVTYAEKGFAI